MLSSKINFGAVNIDLLRNEVKNAKANGEDGVRVVNNSSHKNEEVIITNVPTKPEYNKIKGTPNELYNLKAIIPPDQKEKFSTEAYKVYENNLVVMALVNAKTNVCKNLSIIKDGNALDLLG